VRRREGADLKEHERVEKNVLVLLLGLEARAQVLWFRV
jgi:hypothetical protein